MNDLNLKLIFYLFFYKWDDSESWKKLKVDLMRMQMSAFHFMVGRQKMQEENKDERNMQEC